jgi:hypothetical protein
LQPTGLPLIHAAHHQPVPGIAVFSTVRVLVHLGWGEARIRLSIGSKKAFFIGILILFLELV